MHTLVIFWNLNVIYSVKHEYEGKWDEKTRLTTCDPHAKHTVVNSNTPQEVEEGKEIIFTYDVEFQVRLS
jgi:transmembrane 9 superfamily protein 2/4